MGVSRCICRNVDFTEIREMAVRERLTFDQIAERTGCAGACGLCEPYARIAAITGVCDLPVMRPEQLDAWLERATREAGRHT